MKQFIEQSFHNILWKKYDKDNMEELIWRLQIIHNQIP